jgi:phosphoserine phosphatase
MSSHPGNDPPLFVDLDGTLIAADTLWVSVRRLIRAKPWWLFVLPFYVLGGRAAFKGRVARCVDLDPAGLPYRDDVLEFLRNEKKTGREIILATAADHRVADPISRHVALFDAVMASGDGRNLKGSAKLAAILEYTRGSPFDYMGDSMADLPILEAARTAYLVHPTPRLADQAAKTCRVGRTFD